MCKTLHEGERERERGKIQVKRKPYQWCSLYVCKVLQQALSVVDGGVELGIGVLPLAIQILSTQRTAMAGAGRRRQRTGSTEGGGGRGREQSDM